jgi:hypothetical protein
LQQFINLQVYPGIIQISLSSWASKEKTILAGDLNAKHSFWNSSISNPSGVELLELFHKNEFEISAPQCPTHYSPAGNCDILDIVVHQNIGLSVVTISNILDLDH